MQVVGRLGGYISRGVSTVSGSVRSLGGAVDIVLVEQQDGSFKSSPWYVRFGKPSGVLKAEERVIIINVNGVDASFHMHMDHKGQAFFLREVEAEEGESTFYPSSSGDEADILDNRRHLKSRSFSFEPEISNSMPEIDINRGNILARTNSDGSVPSGLPSELVIGDNNFQREVLNADINGASSLECAEIAANLLEVKWSTNLAGHKPPRKDRVKTQRRKSQRHNTQNSLNQRKLYDEAYSLNEQKGLCSNSDHEIPKGLNEDNDICSSCSNNMVEVSFSKREVISKLSMSVDDTENAEHDRKVNEVLSDRTVRDLEVACLQVEANIEKKQLSGPGDGISEGQIPPDGVQPLVYSEISESSIGCMDCSNERTHEVMYLDNKKGELNAHAEVLQATTVLLPKVTKDEEVSNNADVVMPVLVVSQTSQQTNCSHPGVSNFVVADIEDQTTLPKPQIVNPDIGLCSAEKDESNCATTSSCSSLGNQASEEKLLKVEDVSSTSTSLESVGDCALRKTSRPPSPNSEEKHFVFSGLGENRFRYQLERLNSFEYVDKEDKLFNSFHLSQESRTTDLEKMRVTSSPIIIPNNEEAGGEDRQQTKSLFGRMHSPSNSLDQHDLCHPSIHSQDSKSKQPSFGKDHVKILKPGDQLLPEESGVRDNNTLGDTTSTAMNHPLGVSSELKPSSSRNWRLWPFSFRRSSSEKVEVPAADDKDTNASGGSINKDVDKNEPKPKLLKRNVRAKTPTSEQLASLNLREGRNTVTFTFSAATPEIEQVDAQIYLWKWNTRIVISDVDGTITKSDVLGQVMPLVGVDWSQTGVTHLFSAIKENGYKLLFLSARSISQAYQTRQFLVNLKQDGKVLPDGPVVISPDGIFPSLYREVIRRAPHEFKIACLEDIKALFPPDYNPFYAGFGNRDTDEISYLKVGIPRGKIFIINPKGEIVVNRRHDTKSYTSLHALVHGMFPPATSSEQEDFNSWNFWKLPPPVLD